MKPRMEEFLNVLYWTADQLGRPTFRNLSDSYETWASRNGLLRRVASLEKQQLIERRVGTRDRIYRLTDKGVLQVLGGREPEERWARPWDGKWRLVIYDVPQERNAHRARLRRYLRSQVFGRLQKSVWITPDPLEAERQILGGGQVNVESLVLLEARPGAGEADAQIVAGAWDFEEINQRYSRQLQLLEEYPGDAGKNPRAGRELLRWAAVERQAWLEAIRSDPLLPSRLLPSDYLGQRAWRRRREVFLSAGKQISKFIS